MSTVSPSSPKGQPCPGAYQIQHSKLVERGDCPLFTGAAPPQVLCVVLGTSIQEGQTVRGCPEKGNQHGERLRGQDLQGAAEVTLSVQLGEEKVKG